MSHPLARLSSTQFIRWFWPLLAATLVVMAIMQVIGRPLQTAAAPLGIVSFEFAGDKANAAAMIASWDVNARVHAGFSLGFDYVFMPLYATTIGLACLWAAQVFRRQRWSLAAPGALLAWGLWLAAIFDAVENVALWRLLAGSVFDPWPGLAWWCAALKFGLIVLGLLYVVMGVAARVIRR